MINRVFSTRLGAFGAAALLALAAVLVVLVYAKNYRGNVDKQQGEVSVLVATRQITQFTPANQVVDGHMYRETTVPGDALVDGAITNADQLKGQVARSDIYPGEQLSTNQFQTSSTASIAVKLDPDQRAVSFPVDSASGLVGEIQTGDRVDVVATFDVVPVGANGLPMNAAQPIPMTKTIVTDALVLQAPESGSSRASRTSTVLTLAIDSDQVPSVLFAQEKGSIWFTLRPAGAASDSSKGIVDVTAVLRGTSSATGPVLRLTGTGR